MKTLIKQFALTLILAALSVNVAQALVPAGKQVTGAIALQGGSDSAVKWLAPATATYKVHVLVTKTGTVANALYRVYPRGKKAGSTECASSDVNYPCFEVSVDQTQYLNAWVQLTLNGDVETQWSFTKGKGYVTAVASNLSAEETLNLSALMRFEDTHVNMSIALGKSYQGGIIFYVDGTGQHGLIAAPTDQSTGIQWYSGSYIATGATDTAVGIGQVNTNKIIAVQLTGSYAAQLCADLVIGTYSDWYLPSKDELSLMYQNIGPGAAAPLTNIGEFAGVYYWSSSDFGIGNAWSQYFADSTQSFHLKDATFYVRAVRMF